MTPYQSEDPSPTLPTYTGKEEKGKIVEDQKLESINIKGINIKIGYPTTNMKHTRLVVRTLQLVLQEGAESFPNIKSHTLGTRCGVPQSLLGATKAGGTEL